MPPLTPDETPTRVAPNPAASASSIDSAFAGLAAIHGYEFLGEIHRGGQGIVYRARQLGTDRIVALKTLHAKSADTSAAQHRFRREIDLTARLRHPNIVTIHDSGVDPRPYFVMALVDGDPIDVFVRNQQLGLRETIQLFLKVCDGVAHAHKHGVVHRDLKPQNILVGSDGEPVIVDFGLAKIYRQSHPEDHLSMTGAFLGTFAYASPEQRAGDLKSVDSRTDIYSLGVILFELLTGRLPSELGDGSLRTSGQTGPAALQSASELPKTLVLDLERAFAVATHADREHRYPTVNEFAADLRAWLDGKPLAVRSGRPFYTARRALERWVRTQPRVTSCYAVALAVLVGVAASWMLPRGLNGGWIHRRATAGLTLPWSERVAVIAFDDATYDALPAIAAGVDLPDVASKQILSWRGLHGALLERLARAKPAVVAFDYAFVSTAPQFDAKFARGMRMIQEAGARVVIGAMSQDSDGRPMLSSILVETVDGWGWLALANPDDVVTHALMAVNQPPHPPSPSLSTAAFALSQHREYTPTLRLDSVEELAICYSRPSPENPRMTDWLEEEINLRVSSTKLDYRRGAAQNTKATMRDAMAKLVVTPTRETLDAHTTRYAHVFDMSDAELSEAFHDHVVLVGDARDERTKHPDRRPTACVDGVREEFSCYVHATAISDLLNETGFGPPRRHVTGLAWLGLAVAGLVVGRCCSAMVGVGFLAATALALFAATWWLVIDAQILFGPASGLAVVLVAWWCGRAQRQIRSAIVN